MAVTTIFIAINALTFLLVFGSDFGFYTQIFGLNLYFLQGLFWQPLTSMFMHASWEHLLMNMIVLFQFGSILERFLGTWRFLVVYMIGGISTSLLSFVYIYYIFENNGEFVNLVGASGAICVLLGLLAYLDARSRNGLIIALLLMSFAPLAMGVNVAWYAHLAGFGLGFLYAKWINLRAKDEIF